MRRALEAAWALVSHPLRATLPPPTTVGRDTFDDHGARHATRRRRRRWWAFNLAPAALWLALSIWQFVDGELALGIAYLSAAAALAITVSSVRVAYFRGYMHGGTQVGIDARARAVGRPFDVEQRQMPHPADPLPDLRRLYGVADQVDDDER